MSTVPALKPGSHSEFDLQSSGAGSISAHALRKQIESSFGGRFAGALTPTPRQVRETIPTGIAALDAIISGGVPMGAITELAGPCSSGRTGAAFSTVAFAMREGSMCAWVDASDALDPESAAANGVLLDQLLWVRCGVQTGTAAGQQIVKTSTKVPDAREADARWVQARAGQHPRDEERGLDRAVGDLMRQTEKIGRQNRSIGTPGAPNRRLSGPAPSVETRPFGRVQRDEQVSSDRQPKRGRASASASATAATGDSKVLIPTLSSAGSGTPWVRLDQALRAADLLLQAGGFRVLVLDLGSIAPEDALRIPLATWFRYRKAAEASRTALLAIVQTSCAKSSAGLVIGFGALEALSVPEGSEEIGQELGQEDERSGTVLQFPSGRITESKLEGANSALTLAWRNEGSVIESVCYQAQVMRQRFVAAHEQTCTSDGVGAGAERRPPPQAAWQLSAFPLREEAGSA